MIEPTSNNFVFKSEFFDEHEQKLINEMLVNWNEFLAHFEELCKKLEKSKDRHNIYVIDGSIAAGKTTLINNICMANDTIRIIPEPVDIWKDIGIMDHNENKFINILELFYLARNDEKDKKYVFLFQVIVLVSRVSLMIQKLALYNDNNETIIMERHPLSDNKIFFALSEHLLDDEYVKKYYLMTDYALEYIPNYKWIFVGMSLNPNEHKRCIQQHVRNLKKRNRNEEVTIPLDYMEKLYYQYLKFIQSLNGTQKYVLDYGDTEQDMYIETKKIFNNEPITSYVTIEVLD